MFFEHYVTKMTGSLNRFLLKSWDLYNPLNILLFIRTYFVQLRVLLWLEVLVMMLNYHPSRKLYANPTGRSRFFPEFFPTIYPRKRCEVKED